MSELAEITTFPNPPNGDSMMSRLPTSLNISDQSVRSFEDTFHHFDISAVDYSDLSACPDIPFFAGGERRAVLDEVAHLCQFSHNLVGVLGDAGVGKTALAYQAAIELSETADCCVMVSSLMNSTENMLLLLAQQLGIFITENADLEQITATINQYQPSGVHQSVVIIVDEAHHLDETALYAFVQLLQKPSPNYFHVLLIGDSTLQIKLDRLDKESVLVYDIPLHAFNESEVEHYVSFKLAQVGYQGAELFDANAIEHLWRETRGFPQSINHVANKMLLAVNDIDSRDQRLGLPIGYMAVVVILLAALILAVFYIDDDPPSLPATPEDILASGKESTLTDGKTSQDTVIAIRDAMDEGKLLDNLQSLQSVTPSVLNGALPSDTLKKSEASVGIIGSAEESSFSIVGDIAKNSDAVSAIDEVNKILTVADKTVVEDSATIATPEPVVTISSEPRTLKQPEVVSSSVKPSPTLSAKAKASATNGEVAVMSWPGNNYTVQVMAAGQLASVNRFVNAQSNRDLLRVITLRRNGAPWYVVFTGVYETREEAVSAISFLPLLQKNTQPWPRQISDVQQKISVFRRK
ncbi:MAG: DamX protein [Granulosicoccus sp.]|jgi:DamX protein